MKFPEWLRLRLFAWAQNIYHEKEPDLSIGGRDNPYLNRWYIIPRNKLLCIYLHEFCRDDDDRALHDHPGAFLTFVLHNGYNEVLPGGVTNEVKQGHVYYRSAKYTHRVVLRREDLYLSIIGKMRQLTLLPVTLVVVFPKYREWGFHCPKGWVDWRTFLGVPKNVDNDGRLPTTGCGED